MIQSVPTMLGATAAHAALNPASAFGSIVSRWRPWLEGDPRKVYRHQRRQYELRVPPQSERPGALRSPRRRHGRPHPRPEVLPS